jgi:hypothetical protein
MFLEDFLINRCEEFGKLIIVGGSPLFDEEIPEAISINGFHKECQVAAVNSNRSDSRRCLGNFESVIAPNPVRQLHDSIIIPKNSLKLPDTFPGRQPTTYFSLIMWCEHLGLPTEVYGICGRASRHHYGDWEMWFMKHMTKNIRIYDPRPKW